MSRYGLVGGRPPGSLEAEVEEPDAGAASSGAAAAQGRGSRLGGWGWALLLVAIVGVSAWTTAASFGSSAGVAGATRLSGTRASAAAPRVKPPRKNKRSGSKHGLDADARRRQAEAAAAAKATTSVAAATSLVQGSIVLSGTCAVRGVGATPGPHDKRGAATPCKSCKPSPDASRPWRLPPFAAHPVAQG